MIAFQKAKESAKLLRKQAESIARQPYTKWVCEQAKKGNIVVHNGCPLCVALEKARVAEEKANKLAQETRGDVTQAD